MRASWVLTVFSAPITGQPANTLRRCCSMFTEGDGIAVGSTCSAPWGAMEVVYAAQLGGYAPQGHLSARVLNGPDALLFAAQHGGQCASGPGSSDRLAAQDVN